MTDLFLYSSSSAAEKQDFILAMACVGAIHERIQHLKSQNKGGIESNKKSSQERPTKAAWVVTGNKIVEFSGTQKQVLIYFSQ